jgi:hypothetical protein
MASENHGQSPQQQAMAQLAHEVANTFEHVADQRTKSLLQDFVHVLHRFFQEKKITETEWIHLIMFLTQSGAITTSKRNEFMLLSDVLGITTLVSLLNHPIDATPASNLGPFHNTDSLFRPNGCDLIGTNPGKKLLVKGRVRSPSGEPIRNATLDLWQNADNGLYPEQDPNQDPHNLRCKILVDHGRYSFTTVEPKPYTVPFDGPVGAMLKMSQRDGWRPAHIHFRVSAEGFDPLTTEIFLASDPYVGCDTVFGVSPSLIMQPRDPDAGEISAGFGAMKVIEFDFVLHPAAH